MIRYTRYFFLSITLFAFSAGGNSQNSSGLTLRKIDSLQKVLGGKIPDSTRLEALNSIAWEHVRLKIGNNVNNDQDILKYANEAMLLAKKMKNKYQEGVALHSLGHLSKLNGNFDQAVKIFNSVLKLSEAIGDVECEVNQYCNISDVYLLQGDLSKALQFRQYAVRKAEASGIKKTILITLLSAAQMYQNTMLNDEAVKYFRKAIAAAAEMSDNISMGTSYMQIGNIYKNSGNTVASKLGYLEALNYFDSKTKNTSECYLGLGWTYFMDGVYGLSSNAGENFSTARNYFYRSLEVARIVRSSWFIEQAYIGLAEVYKRLNDFEKALQFTSMRYLFQDSVSKQEQADTVSSIKHRYDQEKIKIEADARQKIFMVNEVAIREKMLNEQKAEQMIAIANEKILRGKAVALEKFQQEKKIAAAKADFDKSFALEKARRDRAIAEQQSKNRFNILLSAGFILFLVFIAIIIRQRNQKKIAIEKANTLHRMTELELQSLRSQLNPHFMFNSLNAIQELILTEDNERSHIYLSRFSKLIRILLENADQPFIPLRKEIDFLHLYLSLENLRVPDMKYTVDIDKNLDNEKTLIPNMILQPYIENAIWHGLSYKEENRQLQLRIYRENGTVNYEIEDNGVGRKKAAELKSLFRRTHTSKGMELLSKRFKLLNEEYSSNINTTITDVINNNHVAGTLVTIKVPVKLSQTILN